MRKMTAASKKTSRKSVDLVDGPRQMPNKHWKCGGEDFLTEPAALAFFIKLKNRRVRMPVE